jgi:hypothetical protein
MQLPFASIPILPAEKEKNFFDLAQILGPLPKAWPGSAACSVDRSGDFTHRSLVVYPLNTCHCG